jgi:hypothetical protein
MDGRILNELLVESRATELTAKKEKLTASAPFDGGKYTLTLYRTIVDDHQYVDFSKVERVFEKP